MKQSHGHLPVTVLVITLTITGILYCGYVYYNEYVNEQIQVFNSFQNNEKNWGYIQPQVVDGFTEEPIKDAEIVIPEINKSFKTNAQGYTESIKVPIIEDEHFKSIYPKSWGEVTIIVFKRGYVDYVLFHVHVWENQYRKGPKILLFPAQKDQKNEPMSIVEGPHRLWVKQLVEKYRR